MRFTITTSAAALLLVGSGLLRDGLGKAGGQQLSEQRDPGQSQGRPTRVGDPIPKFDMDYFVGEWRFQGSVPDSPLGTGGEITGMEVVEKAGDHKMYSITVTGRSPDGPYDGKGILASFDTPISQYAVRYEVTRGMTLSRAGKLGGDLGGRYSQFWETPPFELNGAVIRLKGESFFASPTTYRVKTQIAVNDDVFRDFGTMLYEKQRVGSEPH